MENLQDELNNLPDHILNYFVQNKLSISEFLTHYITIDKYYKQRQISQTSQESLSSTLDTIKLQIDNISNQNIKNDLLKMFNENFTSLNNQFHSQTNSFDQIQSSISKDFDNIKLYINNVLSTHQNNADKKSVEYLSELIKSLSVNDKLSSIHDMISNLHNNLTSHSTIKGAISENILLHKLTSEFPDSSILESKHIPHSGDFIVERPEKTKFLIDIKNYNRNVPKDEITKFYHDIKLQKCSGILCSVKTGISCKKHFEIDIIDNKYITIFLHNFNYDTFMIRLASDIIDHMSCILSNHQNDLVTVSQNKFAEMKTEYDFFISSFQQHLSNIQQNVKSLSNLQLTMLNQFFNSQLIQKVSSKQTKINKITCEKCSKTFASDKTFENHMSKHHP